MLISASVDSRPQRLPATLLGAVSFVLLVIVFTAHAGARTGMGGNKAALALASVVSPTPPTCTGSWEEVASPGVGQLNALQAVEFAAPDDGWAAGQYSPVTGGPERTLIQHWNGAAWTVVTSPNPSANVNELRSLSVLSSTNVWAAGMTSVNHSRDEMALNWDGQTWTYRSTPGSQSNSNDLMDIVAFAPDNVWAIGTYYISFFRPYGLHWNGSSWTHIDMPLIGTNYHHLQRMAAVAANDIWAVGYYRSGPSSTRYYPLIERYDGQTWDLRPAPSQLPGAYTNVLLGVDAVSDTSMGNTVWAAGWYNDFSGDRGRPWVIRWDGALWATVPAPSAGQGSHDIEQVLAISDNDVWVVGGYEPVAGAPGRTLTMHWDGTAWTIVPSANPGGGTNTLIDITASGDTLWAVGYSYDVSGNQTPLIERFDRRCAVPTATPTNTPTSTSSRTPTHTPTATYTHTPVPASTSTATFSVTSTGTPTATATATATSDLTNTPMPTATPCVMTFTDVQPSDYFYEPVRHLLCQGVISGYADNTFRPSNATTRGQLTKIAVLAFHIPQYTPPTPTFTDVPVTSPFYVYIETAAFHNMVQGYSDGTFRPGNNVTRGQVCKIVVNTAGWTPINPPNPTFSDVPAGSGFYEYIETAYARGIISGYSDGTFRPGNDATRGQISKIVYRAIPYDRR